MSTASVPGLGSAPQPPLQTGDRLTRAEFQRRLEDLPDGVKAELIAEIAASSGRRDLHNKLHAYERNGVQEYIAWRTYDSAIDWFVLRGGRYEKLSPAADGMYRSKVFPGLWLDATALIRGDLAAVLAVLQQGTASPAHTDFIARLQAAKAP